MAQCQFYESAYTCIFNPASTVSTVTTFSLLMLKVIFIRDGSRGQLIIDGLNTSTQGSNVSWHVSSPIYVGGVPPGRAQRNIQVWDKVNVKHISLENLLSVDQNEYSIKVCGSE